MGYGRVLLFLLLISCSYIGTNAYALCPADEILSIPRPIDPAGGYNPNLVGEDDVQGNTFQYKFKWIRARDPRAPFLFFLPGGPGQPGIIDPPYTQYLSPLIGQYNMVYADARGIFKNARPGQFFPLHAFRSRVFAEDYKAVLRYIQMSCRKPSGLRDPIPVAIMGVSYGTVPATLMSFSIQRADDFNLLFTILDSTIGGRYNELEVFEAYRDVLPNLIPALVTVHLQNGYTTSQARIEAMRLYNQITFDSRFFYLANANRTIFGEPENDFRMRLLQRERFGAYDQLAHEIYNMTRPVLADGHTQMGPMQPIVPLPPRPAIVTTSTPGLQDATMNPQAADWLREIRCREYSGLDTFSHSIWNLRTQMIDGDFLHNFVGSCTGFSTEALLLRSYSSAHYPLIRPVIYLQGGIDPATPNRHVTIHFQGQRQADRTLIYFPERAHAVMGTIFNSSPETHNAVFSTLFRRYSPGANVVSAPAVQPPTVAQEILHLLRDGGMNPTIHTCRAGVNCRLNLN